MIHAKLSNRLLKKGILYIPKDAATHFPKGFRLRKIEVIFSVDKQVVKYNPERRLIFGLKKLYLKHKLKAGDALLIEPITPFRIYRFKVDRGGAVKQVKKTLIVKREKSRVGEAINFRGLVYAPVNEQGVIFLFATVMKDLKMYLEEIRTSFPDAVGRRFDGRGWVKVNIEFEYKSSDYKLHKHPTEGCDIIICWEHDWNECPLEVIELKSVIRQLPSA